MNLQLKWNELKGNPLTRFRIYFEKVGNIPLIILNEDWQYILAIDRLRNTFAHSLGEVREEDRKTLETLASTNKGLQLTDGYVYANMEFTHEAIDKAQRIIGVCVGRIGQPEVDKMMSQFRKTISKA